MDGWGKVYIARYLPSLSVEAAEALAATTPLSPNGYRTITLLSRYNKLINIKIYALILSIHEMNRPIHYIRCAWKYGISKANDKLDIIALKVGLILYDSANT